MLKNFVNANPQREQFASLFGSGNVPGLLSDSDMDIAIPLLCQKLPSSGIFVEVGCFLGKSSVEWAKNFKNLNKNYKILCIDSFNSPIDILHDLLTKAEFDIPVGPVSQLEMFEYYTSCYSNIKPIKGFFNQQFDFPGRVTGVFEDSTHSMEYLNHALPFWWNKLEVNGILSGHDYGGEVQTAVDLFAALNDLTVQTFNDSSIWYIEKN